MRPVFERFPGLQARVPFEPLATLPTPVERRLGLWIKRDDRTHPELGGGKIRKLEFYVPKRPALAVGTRGSNWLVALQRFRRDVRIFTIPQHLNEAAAANARRLRPERHFTDELFFAVRFLAEVPRLLGDSLDLAPMGGTDPVTTLGYVNAALELGEQVRRGECPEPDAIFVALGSGGTAAGLALGLPLAGLRSKLVAVRVTIPPIARLGRVHDLATQCAWLLDLKRVRCAEVELVGDGWGGYAKPTPAGREAQARFAGAGLALDPSYTAKAAAVALARASSFRAPLLWHTYGGVR
jgi:D-cysteine desulfhydrase